MQLAPQKRRNCRARLAADVKTAKSVVTPSGAGQPTPAAANPSSGALPALSLKQRNTRQAFVHFHALNN